MRRADNSALAAGIGSSEASPATGTSHPRLPRGPLFALIALAAILLPSVAFAQDISVNFGDDTTLTERALRDARARRATPADAAAS